VGQPSQRRHPDGYKEGAHERKQRHPRSQRGRHTDSVDSLRPRVKDSLIPLLRFAAGLIAGGLTLLAVFGVQLTGKWVKTAFTGIPKDRGRWLRNTTLISAFSILEELAFRLLLISVLRRYVAIDLAVLVSSVAFGLLHATNASGRDRWILAVEASLAGLWFGYAFVAFGSITFAFGLHVGWNLAMWQLFGYPEQGRTRLGFEGFFTTRATEPGLLSGGDYAPEASLPAMFANVIWAVAMRSML
jgi:membrane protease YdiL (CAAX protease family)